MHFLIIQNTAAVQFGPGVLAGGKVVGGEIGSVSTFALTRIGLP